MPEFTPGPWVAIETTHRTLICAAQGDHVTACEKPAPADARLIAAAPELLAALQAMLHRFGDATDKPTPAELLAKAAIEKATGA